MTDYARGGYTIQEWIVLERMRLEQFVRFWREGANGQNSRIPKDAFPTQLPDGEWNEQFRLWSGT